MEEVVVVDSSLLLSVVLMLKMMEVDLEGANWR
jgi:hypothetical protein